MNISNMENPSFLQKDIMYFKDDILNSIKELTTKFTTQFTNTSNELHSHLKAYDTKLETLSKKIFDLSLLITKDKTLTDKISTLSEFKESTESTLTTLQIRETLLSKQITDAIYKYDKVIIDNLLLPGIIGKNCKFKTFRAFTDFLLTQISQFSTFKDKQILDLESYKTKLESLTKSLTMQINALNTTISTQTHQSISNSEERLKELLQLNDNRIEEMRIENSKYVIDLKTQNNSLLNEWKKVVDIKQEIFKRFDKEVMEIINKNKEMVNMFDGYKREFKLIKNRFTQLSEFIKDARFRSNVGGVSKKEAFNISNAINFGKKQIYKEELSDGNNNNENEKIKEKEGGESFLKKYIFGEVDLDTFLEPRRTRKENLSKFSFQKHTPDHNEIPILSKSSSNINLGYSNIKAANVNKMYNNNLFKIKEKHNDNIDGSDSMHSKRNENEISNRNNNVDNIKQKPIMNYSYKEHKLNDMKQQIHMKQKSNSQEHKHKKQIYNKQQNKLTSRIDKEINTDKIIENENTHNHLETNENDTHKTINEIENKKQNNDNNPSVKINQNLSTSIINFNNEHILITPKIHNHNNNVDIFQNQKIRLLAKTNDSIFKNTNSDAFVNKHIRNKKTHWSYSQEQIIPSQKYIEFPSTNIEPEPMISLIEKSATHKHSKKLKDYINKIREESPGSMNQSLNMQKRQCEKGKRNTMKLKRGSMNTSQGNHFLQEFYSNEMVNNVYYNMMVNDDILIKNENKNEYKNEYINSNNNNS